MFWCKKTDIVIMVAVKNIQLTVYLKKLWFFYLLDTTDVQLYISCLMHVMYLLLL